MSRIIIFAGTTEGRFLCEYAIEQNIPVTVCVATEYGEIVLPESQWLEVHVGRKNKDEISHLLGEKEATLVIDATHPYAVNVTENIQSACKEAGVAYERVIRESLLENATHSEGNVLFFTSIPEVVTYLSQVEGNALITTGSKELKPYVKIPNWKHRLTFRMLPTVEAMTSCEQLGILAKQIIAMQGPFSEEMNTLMLRERNASFLVTKESGEIGGFLEKCRAARKADATVLIIGRPRIEQGKTVEQMKVLVR